MFDRGREGREGSCERAISIPVAPEYWRPCVPARGRPAVLRRQAGDSLFATGGKLAICRPVAVASCRRVIPDSSAGRAIDC